MSETEAAAKEENEEVKEAPVEDNGGGDEGEKEKVSEAEDHSSPQIPEDVRGSFNKLLSQLDEMEEMLNGPETDVELTVPEVSKWSVLQQLDHNVTVIKGGLALVFMLINSPNPSSEGGPSFLGRVVLWAGFVPRGKGKAPAQVHPKSKDIDEVKKNLAEMKMFVKTIEPRLEEVAKCEGKAPHPVLGAFTAAQWIRFIEVHNHHHFKIIRDIKKKKA